eukprot:2013024-Amphidinium_carterae.1
MGIPQDWPSKVSNDRFLFFGISRVARAHGCSWQSVSGFTSTDQPPFTGLDQVLPVLISPQVKLNQTGNPSQTGEKRQISTGRT